MAEGLLDLQIEEPGGVMVVLLPGVAASPLLMRQGWGEPCAEAEDLLQFLSCSAELST